MTLQICVISGAPTDVRVCSRCTKIRCYAARVPHQAYTPGERQAVAERPADTSTDRKATPIFSGVLRYFPAALAAVARLSRVGNDKHNPGEPLHWSRGKSNDHGDCLVRHQVTFDQIDSENGEYHAVAVAWRALAQLQLLEEARVVDKGNCVHTFTAWGTDEICAKCGRKS